MIEMRNRLIDLLQENSYLDVLNDEHWLLAAEQLLANGVIVPPIKIGQTVYVISRYYGGFWRTHECKIDSLTIYEKHIFMTLFDRDNFDFGIEISEIGKTVFLTKEEAEKALAERSGNELA
jgi:hypothetical protein